MDGLKIGDEFTIAGWYAPDLRWWPRFRNWVLRRPPPTLKVLQKFRITEMHTSGASGIGV